MRHLDPTRAILPLVLPIVAALTAPSARGALPPAPAACREVEPNELPAQASPLPAGEVCGGEARATDTGGIVITFPDGTPDPVEDLFTFTLGGSSRVDLTLALSGSADLDLYLFSVRGDEVTTLALSTDGGAVERIRADALPAGTYYVGVSAYAGGTAYSLSSAITPAGAAGCVEDDTTLCLSGGRFRVTADWATVDGATGRGHALRLTPDTGTFWFFASSNLEMMVKVLNACSFAGRYWVFAGGLTDVQVTLTVTDTKSARVRTWVNPQKTAFAPIQDTDAFPTCP